MILIFDGTLILNAASSLPPENENVQEATSAGADSSTQLSKDKKCVNFAFLSFSLSFKFYATAHRILQPTPLVLALRSQLISQVTEKDQLHPQALDDNQQQDSAEKGLANEDEVFHDVKEGTEIKHERDLPGDSLTIASQVSK